MGGPPHPGRGHKGEHDGVGGRQGKAEMRRGARALGGGSEQVDEEDGVRHPRCNAARWLPPPSNLAARIRKNLLRCCWRAAAF